jgi:hypothetical protein
VEAVTPRFERQPSGPVTAASWATALIAVVSVCVLAYATARAAVVPLTYDEAATYHRYVKADPLAVFDVSVATNHLLNTVLTRAAAALAGTHELTLRLSTLCGLAMYLWFAAANVRRMQHRLVAAGTFLLLTLNPYVLDYFALSRGYGLSLGLLMGGLCFLIRLIDDDRRDGGNRRNLAWSLLLTGAAVAANFSLLVAYAAIWCAALIVQMGRRTRLPGEHRPAAQSSASARRSHLVIPAIAAIVFTGLVLSQDVGLSPRLHEPVSVRIVGLFDEELEPIVVERLDTRLRWRPLVRTGEVWRMERREQVRALRISLPPVAARNLTLIDTTIGGQSFTHGRHADRLWTSRDADGTRLLESSSELSLRHATIPAMQPAINWAGDGRHAVVLATATLIVAGLLGSIALALWSAGRLAEHHGLIDAPTWQTLARGAVWIVALVAGPAHILRRDGQLYFGGDIGLVSDTFGSVISNSFYGVVYHQQQIDIVLAVVASTVLLFGAVVAGALKHGRGSAMATPGVLFGVLALASVATVVQHVALGTPYLRDRTALFFIPSYVLFLGFLCDRLSVVHRRLRAVAAAGLGVLGILSAWHLATTANVTRVFDWPRDADSRQMLADLQRVERERGGGTDVVLGVDWIFYPVARFYAERGHPSDVRVEVDVVPSERAVDYLYLMSGDPVAEGRELADYPRAGAVLLQLDRTD